jgi:hypothetical protein
VTHQKDSLQPPANNVGECYITDLYRVAPDHGPDCYEKCMSVPGCYSQACIHSCSGYDIPPMGFPRR